MHTLFEILTGRFAKEDLPIDSVAKDQTIYKSIQTHLTRLLNARQGSLKHMPDYGLPDVSEIYQALPYSVNDLLHAVAKTVAKYEPRLTNVYVKQKEENNLDQDCVLSLEIQAELMQGGRIQFETYFMTGGKTVVA